MRLGIAAASAIALIMLAAAPAVPQPAEPRSSLSLTVSQGEAPDPDTPRRATLQCDPPGGTHPSPAAACGRLAQAGGDPNRLDADPDTSCAAIYDPVTATAAGAWEGRPVDWQRTYGNDCELQRATTPVFDF